METKGQKIKKFRKNAGYTQKDLAEILNVAKNTISAWERDVQSPTFEKLEFLCDILGVTMQEFFKGEPPRRESLTEVAEYLESMTAEVPDLKALFKRYLQLDDYGQEAVKNLIHNETYRCEAMDTLQDINNYIIEVRYTE